MPAKCQHWRIGICLALTLILVGSRIQVTRRTLAMSVPQVTMKSPEGSMRTIDLKQTSRGRSLGVIDVDKLGFYASTTRRCATLLPVAAAVGDADPLESSDMRDRGQAQVPGRCLERWADRNPVVSP
jgi:hypothetical protein